MLHWLCGGDHLRGREKQTQPTRLRRTRQRTGDEYRSGNQYPCQHDRLDMQHGGKLRCLGCKNPKSHYGAAGAGVTVPNSADCQRLACLLKIDLA